MPSANYKKEVTTVKDKMNRAGGNPVKMLRRLASGDARAIGTGLKCGSCTACCRSGYTVSIYPWESGEGLDIIEQGGRKALRRNADGSCVHLGEHGCTVYDKRPLECQTYDCRLFALGGVAFGENTRGVSVEPLNEAIASWRFEFDGREDIAVALAYRLKVQSHVRATGCTVEEACALAMREWPNTLKAAEFMLECAPDEQRRHVVQALRHPASGMGAAHHD